MNGAAAGKDLAHFAARGNRLKCAKWDMREVGLFAWTGRPEREKASALRKPFKFREWDGGRDKDRTCDPYDVNTASSLKPLIASGIGPSCKRLCSFGVLLFLGRKLGVYYSFVSGVVIAGCFSAMLHSSHCEQWGGSDA